MDEIELLNERMTRLREYADKIERYGQQVKELHKDCERLLDDLRQRRDESE